MCLSHSTVVELSIKYQSYESITIEAEEDRAIPPGFNLQVTKHFIRLQITVKEDDDGS